MEVSAGTATSPPSNHPPTRSEHHLRSSNNNLAVANSHRTVPHRKGRLYLNAISSFPLGFSYLSLKVDTWTHLLTLISHGLMMTYLLYLCAGIRFILDESSTTVISLINFTSTEEDLEMVLDLHDHGAKEAKCLLKCHLSSLSGIPSYEYMKVIIDANDQDKTKQSRRRLVILKPLEEESIKWVESETTGTILIRLDSIERKR